MTINPKSLENLIKYKKGQSGNPKGKPKGATGPYFTTILKKILEAEKQDVDPFTEESKKFTVRELLMYKLVKLAADGNLKAIREILDRVEGPVTQKVEQVSNVTLSESSKSLEDRIEELAGYLESEKNEVDG